MMETEGPDQEPAESCICCKRSDEEVPIVTWRFRGQRFYLCPEHLPLLIHAPQELASLLPMPSRTSRKGAP